MEAMLRRRGVAIEPDSASRLQEVMRADNIRIDKRRGTGN